MVRLVRLLGLCLDLLEWCFGFQRYHSSRVIERIRYGMVRMNDGWTNERKNEIQYISVTGQKHQAGGRFVPLLLIVQEATSCTLSIYCY